FKHAIDRILSPTVGSPGAVYFHDIASMVADGQTLTITLNAPAPDFLDRIAMPFACAVPHDTPLAPVGAPLASAGPYYVASYTPGGTAVLQRNPSYTGSRPSGFDEIDSKDDVPPATPEPHVPAGPPHFP